VFAPMPSARVTSATAVNIGAKTNRRKMSLMGFMRVIREIVLRGSTENFEFYFRPLKD
jgi:hypothetical protein